MDFYRETCCALSISNLHVACGDKKPQLSWNIKTIWTIHFGRRIFEPLYKAIKGTINQCFFCNRTYFLCLKSVLGQNSIWPSCLKTRSKFCKSLPGKLLNTELKFNWSYTMDSWAIHWTHKVVQALLDPLLHILKQSSHDRMNLPDQGATVTPFLGFQLPDQLSLCPACVS